MNEPKITAGLVAQVIHGGNGLRCGTCRRKAADVEVVRAPGPGPQFWVLVKCHGESETLTVDIDPLDLARTRWPRVVFLRNWASHGEISPAARRERREARG